MSATIINFAERCRPGLDAEKRSLAHVPESAREYVVPILVNALAAIGNGDYCGAASRVESALKVLRWIADTFTMKEGDAVDLERRRMRIARAKRAAETRRRNREKREGAAEQLPGGGGIA